MNEKYNCIHCGYELKKDEIPCPKCGLKGRKISIDIHEKLEISDSLKLHLKRGEKREDGKLKKEIISRIKNGTEKRIIKDRIGKKTQATFIVWRDGKLHHFHDKTSELIEIWQKEDNIYKDKEGNLYNRITSKKDNSTEVFVDSKGKEYRFLVR